MTVCGSDGISYNTECDLHRQACLQNSDITIKHRGICWHSSKTINSTQPQSPCSKKKCLFGSYCAVREEEVVCECPECSEGIILIVLLYLSSIVFIFY